MKSVRIEGIEDFVMKINPFVLRNEKDELINFSSDEALYKETLERLYKAGPYYVDMVLFCKDTIGLSFSDSKRFVDSWVRFRRRKDQFYLFDWRSLEGRKQALLDCTEIMIGLHSLSETKFNHSAFSSAFSEFVNGLTERKENEGRHDYSIDDGMLAP